MVVNLLLIEIDVCCSPQLRGDAVVLPDEEDMDGGQAGVLVHPDVAGHVGETVRRALHVVHLRQQHVAVLRRGGHAAAHRGVPQTLSLEMEDG